MRDTTSTSDLILSWSIQSITGLEILVMLINTHRAAEAF